jgi:hypothetical protein
VWLAEYRKTAGTRPVLPEPDEDKGPTIRDLAGNWIALRERDPKLSPAIVSERLEYRHARTPAW